MAKDKGVNDDAVLDAGNPEVKRARLSKLIVKNFRCIGSTAVEIELNDIVVLVGGNNVGKSSILKAYEIVMNNGSKEGFLTLDDFPEAIVDANNLPEIEIQTIVYDNSPGARWITTQANGEMLVREKFTWEEVNKAPTRQGWDFETSAWSTQVPWGAPNVANSRRPIPHRVDAFDDPTKQALEIKKLLKKVLDDKVKAHKSFEDDQSEYRQLVKKVEALQQAIVKEAQGEIEQINSELSTMISQVFPNYKVDFDPRTEEGLDKTINLFNGDAQLLMGPEDGFMSTIERQGSGARRTLLWSALKYIADTNQKRNDDGTPVRPHLLLLDEPEICLHPNAIREACKVLYNLPNNEWQVMLTTHSPIFIDFSKDNTTIIKVERGDNNGAIIGTTVYRPDKLKLSDDDKLNLKLLNICDPYVAEFFFGGKTIIVEGDTEYTAFKYIIQTKPEQYKDIHIIRARGKATIVSLVKILNQFGSNYAVLHDADSPLVAKNGNKNPAWTINESILKEVALKPNGIKVRHLTSMCDFERAYFNKEVQGEKPYNALKQLSSNQEFFATVEQLLKCLIDYDEKTPQNCIEWGSIEQLAAAYSEFSENAVS